MSLTNAQRDALLLAIAAKICPDQIPVIQEQATGKRKPFADVIGYSEGLEIISGMEEPLSLVAFAQRVSVMSSALERVNISLGYPLSLLNASKAQAANVWKTFCTKRGW